MGHIFGSLVRNLVAIACVTGLAFAIGYRSFAPLSNWLITSCILITFSLAMTAVAVVLGLAASSPDAASAYGMPMMFLSYFTGALVPINTMPKPLQAFCTYQPVNIVWKAISGLTLGGTNYSVLSAFAWCVGITVVCLIIGGALFARKTRK